MRKEENLLEISKCLGIVSIFFEIKVGGYCEQNSFQIYTNALHSTHISTAWLLPSEAGVIAETGNTATVLAHAIY